MRVPYVQHQRLKDRTPRFTQHKAALGPYHQPPMVLLVLVLHAHAFCKTSWWT